MFCSSLYDERRTQEGTVVEIVQEYCTTQCCTYYETCPTTHLDTPMCGFYGCAQCTCCQGFQNANLNASVIDTNIYVCRECHVEGPSFHPAPTCMYNCFNPTEHITLEDQFLPTYIKPEPPSPYPQSPPPGYSNSDGDGTEDYTCSGDWARTMGAGNEFLNEEIDRKIKVEKEETCSTPQTFKYNLGSPSSDYDQKGTSPCSDSEDSSDSTDLDTNMTGTKGNDHEFDHYRSGTPNNHFANVRANLDDFRAWILASYDTYCFDDNNPLLGLSDPLQEAMQRMGEGDISMSILYLEAALRRNPPYTAPYRATAWLFLGFCQAANEDDVLAIAAFRECIKLEPNNQNALMSLAVSYANESQGNLAVEAILQWLHSEPNYCEFVDVLTPAEGNDMFAPLNADFFLNIHRILLMIIHTCREGFRDPNIHCAMGVLYSLVGNYSLAMEHFYACVLLVPRDERLWNRLGACLANSNRHYEAMKSYSYALRLVPGYVRAEFNWAVSCSKMGDYVGAIEHLLGALNKQAKLKKGFVGRTSTCIWVLLKDLMTTFGEPRLIEAVDKRDVDTLNRIFGIE